MGFSSPSIKPTPPAVTYNDVTQESQGASDRERNRRRLASAVNTKSTILTQGDQSGSSKTLLGQ